jgi:hypothetical protein
MTPVEARQLAFRPHRPLEAPQTADTPGPSKPVYRIIHGAARVARAIASSTVECPSEKSRPAARGGAPCVRFRVVLSIATM